ncbi:MAG: hypothetical protein ACM3O9_09280 [Methylocystaceae bacterium]
MTTNNVGCLAVLLKRSKQMIVVPRWPRNVIIVLRNLSSLKIFCAARVLCASRQRRQARRGAEGSILRPSAT